MTTMPDAPDREQLEKWAEWLDDVARVTAAQQHRVNQDEDVVRLHVIAAFLRSCIPIPVGERLPGTTPLRGTPLDEDGSIRFSRKEPSDMSEQESKQLPEPPWRVLATVNAWHYSNGANVRGPTGPVWCLVYLSLALLMQDGFPAAALKDLEIIDHPRNDPEGVKIIEDAKREPERPERGGK